jgi:hypothetical protein
MGRPSKIIKFTEAIETILNKPHGVGYAIIHTDEDLVDMVNELLDPDDRVSDRTFREYKAGNLQDQALLDVFLPLYKRALRDQRDNLFERLQSEPPGAWQKFAWIIERKFETWNLRSRSVDETPTPKELVFRVSGGSVT